jgi:hypothetical protein
MNEENIQSKKPDEIYCPNCAKPINKEAVICPNCGVQVKELKTTVEAVPLTPVDEISEGKRLIGGIKVWFWVIIVTFGLFFIIFFIVNTVQIAEGSTVMAQASFILTFFFAIAIWLALFIVPLVAMAQRKPFAVPFTRAMLVISMFWFPIGTIIGSVLWSRINHPYAKKYLNYLG